MSSAPMTTHWAPSRATSSRGGGLVCQHPEAGQGPGQPGRLVDGERPRPADHGGEPD
jgi:hypothetical protein